MRKPAMNFFQIWNMSFGFLGIQIGFILQNGNVSAIFQSLGADIGSLAILWIAAPMTGLIVQPIIGHFSDKTWGPLGRRRPYFLAGAILSTLALFVMPNSPTLWVAAGMLWIMDASLNITMEPFRAFVGDNLPNRQRAVGYAMQSFFIAVGAVIAGALPWVMTNWFGLDNTAPAGEIPVTVQLAFYVGGAFLFVAVIWTVLTTREYSPEELETFAAARRAAIGLEEEQGIKSVQRSASAFFSGGMIWLVLGLLVGGFVFFARAEPRPDMLGFLGAVEIDQQLYVLAGLIGVFGLVQLVAGLMRQTKSDQNGFMEVVNDLFDMPKTMRQLAVVQFFSWFAMFAMWIYAVPGIAGYHYGSPDPTSQGYGDARDWWNLLLSIQNVVSAAAALGFIWLALRMDRRHLHSANLLLGAAGFTSMLFIKDPALLWVSMVGVGFAWASIVAIPYAILAGSVPYSKMGIYMGIFNIFIVVPQLVAATLLGFLLKTFFNSEPIWALMIAAGSFVLAAIATQFVSDVIDDVADAKPQPAGA